MFVPSSYLAGHGAARAVDPEFADRYIHHALVGDHSADAVVAELAEDCTPAQVHAIIARALANHRNLPRDVPACLRDLIEALAEPPEWFDEQLAGAATRGFLRNSDMVFGGLVGGAIIEGFSTLISKSFRIRGRIVDNGVRRLKQNLLQLVEQYLPGGIQPGGDGWKLSIRIRLIHAAARRLIRPAPEWDASALGTPISAAHILLGAAAFSGRLMQHVQNLGGDFSAEEREGYVHVWRYAGWLMGIPEAILFRDFASSVHAFELGRLCEPPPDDDAIIMAHSIVNSAPIVLGKTEPGPRRKMAAYIFQVSRELIGDELAGQLRYPASGVVRELPLLRLKNRLKRTGGRFIPGWRARASMARFSEMVRVSHLGQFEHSYSLPTSVFDEDSLPW